MGGARVLHQWQAGHSVPGKGDPRKDTAECGVSVKSISYSLECRQLASLKDRLPLWQKQKLASLPPAAALGERDGLKGFIN